jgi:cytochrome c2
MRNILRFSVAPALALVLAACGSDAEQADGAAGEAIDSSEVAAAEGAAGIASESAADAAGAEGEGTAEGPAPTPSASASPTPALSPTSTPPRAAAAPATPPAAFATCGVCHSVNAGENRIGPSLAGVVGRRSGSVPGAAYSPAMQGANVTWTEANLERYLADPAAIAPGGTMPNPGMNADQRRAIIDYLKTL